MFKATRVGLLTSLLFLHDSNICDSFLQPADGTTVQTTVLFSSARERCASASCLQMRLLLLRHCYHTHRRRHSNINNLTIHVPTALCGA